MSSLIFLSYVLTCACLIQLVYPSCSELGYCNGNGICKQSHCECFEGWGANTDITKYRSPDCSARTCPSDISWGDVPSYTGDNHRIAECSDKGTCNRVTGKCKCSEGFEGAACQRLKCLNNCSGHGRCMTLERLASEPTAFPLSDPSTYEGSNVRIAAYISFNTNIIKHQFPIYLFFFTFLCCKSTAAWDSRKIVACLCESSWPVGLGANQTQEAEWFGPDCSLRKNDFVLSPLGLLFFELQYFYIACVYFWRRSMPICGQSSHPIQRDGLPPTCCGDQRSGRARQPDARRGWQHVSCRLRQPGYLRLQHWYLSLLRRPVRHRLLATGAAGRQVLQPRWYLFPAAHAAGGNGAGYGAVQRRRRRVRHIL